MIDNSQTNDFDDSDSDDDRLVAAVKEFMQLREAGTAPDLELFLSQHADLADDLRPALEGLDMVEQADLSSSPVSDVPDSEFIARPIGDFQVVREIGRGGMGVVYEAIQLSLGRRIALKVLPFASALDEVRLQRFRNEAHAAAALHHTNIVPVYAVGSDRGVHYYAMQLINGCTLAELIDNLRENQRDEGNQTKESSAAQRVTDSIPQPPRRGPSASPSDPISSDGKDVEASRQPAAALTSTALTWDTTRLNSQVERRKHYSTVVRYVEQAAWALNHAHEYGVIHRDIKPANLLLDNSGKIWVTDFGLAQIQAADGVLTRSGDPMGTLRYMSPEQASGDRAGLDHRTDIYSLGITLYELLTLRPAIEGQGYRELLEKVLERDPPAPQSIDASLPIELDTIVRKAIAKVPSERYDSAAAMADDLHRWLTDRPITAKPPSLLERFSKWRRRNSGLVTAASVLMLLSTIILGATTAIVWREREQTEQALERETVQRQLAEERFRLARNAVDTFNELSESELANEPMLQDLRRSFLETSLEFYRDFIDQSTDDPEMATELQATSARVANMVEELTILENIAPLILLNDSRIRDEVNVDNSQARLVLTSLVEMHQQRRDLADPYSTETMESMPELLRQLEAYIGEQLEPGQIERLRQISRQLRLPFTFKSSEVVAELELTREQRLAINRIIEDSRPQRGEPGGPRERRGDGRSREEPDFRRSFGGPPMRGRGSIFRGGFQGVPSNDGNAEPPPFVHRPPPDGERRPPPDGERRPPQDPGRSPPSRLNPRMIEASNRTVARILQILDETQKWKWDRMIGEPFIPGLKPR